MSEWTKSSYCTAGTCVEAKPVWVRSTACSDGHCVEVAADEQHILVRDSKNPDRPVLEFTRDEWTAFLDGVQAGDFAQL